MEKRQRNERLDEAMEKLGELRGGLDDLELALVELRESEARLSARRTRRILREAVKKRARAPLGAKVIPLSVLEDDGATLDD